MIYKRLLTYVRVTPRLPVCLFVFTPSHQSKSC